MYGTDLESSNRRRWHLISGLTVCTAIYVVSLTLLRAFAF
jgi:hypothetical protein